MNYELRFYQKEAVDSVAKAIGAGDKRVLVVAATGAGKSLMIASLVQRFLARYQDQRVLILAHQSTLIKQNCEKVRSFCADKSVGIYCAELDEKNTTAQIILASRDSLARKPDICGKFGLVLLDEAHLASEELEKPKSQYGKIFCAQNLETLFCVGFTATPWRLKSGNIWGEERFFKKCVYNIGTDFLISQGFLSAYSYPKSKTVIDPGSIKKTAGDFNLGELETCSIKVVEQSLAEWHFKAAGRDLTLFFCVGKAHAKLVAEKLQKYLPAEAIQYIDGETEEKTDLIAGLSKNTKIKAIVSIAVLTTGTDIPRIDCICMLRATQSVTLFIQCVGRGLRLHPGKTDCLILDFTDNSTRFRSIDKPFIAQPSTLQSSPQKSGNSEDLQKICPSCKIACSVACKQCEFCGHLFINHSAKVYEKKDSQWYFVHKITPEDRSRITITGKLAKVIKWSTIDGDFYSWHFVENKFRMFEYEQILSLKGNILGIKGGLSGKIINISEFLIENFDGDKVSVKCQFNYREPWIIVGNNNEGV